MKRSWLIIIFGFFFCTELAVVAVTQGNSRFGGDAAEVHNIGWNVAKNGEYRFDYDDPDWRRLWESANVNGSLNSILVRHGSYSTMVRPPLQPLLVALFVRLIPEHSFIAWRVLDTLAFSLAACLLCDIAYSYGAMFGLAVMILILLADPLRRDFIPSWWTEGLAFDLVAVTIWLFARARRHRYAVYITFCGLALGLLGLDRGIFAILCIPLCALMAFARSQGFLPRCQLAFGILLIASLVQMPWWIRNLHASHRFLPLGTQAGVNLPDEYGDVAMRNHGEWTGFGMRYALFASDESRYADLIPSGTSEEKFENFYAADPRIQSAFDRNFGDGLRSEIAANDIGRRFAANWIRSNLRKLPKLILMKIYCLTRDERRSIFFCSLITMLAFFGSKRDRSCFIFMWAFIAIYVAGIAVTHVVIHRFLVPMLPPFYVAIVVGAAVGIRVLRQLPESTFTDRSADADPSLA